MAENSQKWSKSHDIEVWWRWDLKECKNVRVGSVLALFLVRIGQLLRVKKVSPKIAVFLSKVPSSCEFCNLGEVCTQA